MFTIKSFTIPKRLKPAIVISAAGVLFIIGLVFLISFTVSYLSGVTEAKDLKALYEKGQETESTVVISSVTDSEVPGGTTDSKDGELQQENAAEEKIVLQEYAELIKVNDEVIGWIKLDDTRIDYPLLQHDDNEYYLHHNIEGEASKRGCVYIDYRNNPELMDKNTLIYAHNMKDGSMFKAIISYKKKDFFLANRLININTLYEKGVWQVFSVYVVDANKETINIDYSGEGSFMEAVEKYKKRSMFETDTQIGADDRVVTLVTCSYETNNSRTIVHAKYIGEGQ